MYALIIAVVSKLSDEHFQDARDLRLFFIFPFPFAHPFVSPPYLLLLKETKELLVPIALRCVLIMARCIAFFSTAID